MSSPEVEIARQQWQAGSRRLEEARREPQLYDRLLHQVDAVTAELRRRVGQTFSLADLVRAYRGADQWSLVTIEASDGEPGWEREAGVVADTAFHLYSRGAVDYAP